MEAIGENGEIDTSGRRAVEEVSSGYTRFREGDVVVAKITPCFENGKGAVASQLLNGVGFGTTELYVLTPGPQLDANFLYYLTVSSAFRGLGEAAMTGAAGQKRVPEQFVLDFPLWLPEISLQQLIVRYLEAETGRIDALVAEKERMLALLEEKRAALISRAVTRGLDPDAPLKPSGLDWLGDIPAHWTVERLKFHLHRLEQGWSPQCDNYPAGDDEWGVLKVGAVNSWKFNPRENKALPDSELPIEHYKIRLHDVLMSRANTRELLGSVAIVENVRPKLLLCDKLYRLDVMDARLSREFLVAFLRSRSGRYLFEQEATGASGSMQNIGQDTVRNVWIPVPPKHEQNEIASALDHERNRTAEIEAALNRSISLLKERRSALITAAVTGQIEPEAMRA